jgi:hypothetical protein
LEHVARIISGSTVQSISRLKTTYDILNSRKCRTKTIGNYAKQKTLEQFDNIFAIFLKQNFPCGGIL